MVKKELWISWVSLAASYTLEDCFFPKLYGWFDSIQIGLSSNLGEPTRTYILIVSRRELDALSFYLITPANQVKSKSKLAGKSPFRVGSLGEAQYRRICYWNPKKAGWGGCCVVVMGTGSLVLWGILVVFHYFQQYGWALGLKDGLSLARQLNLDKINTKLDAKVIFFFFFQSFHCKSHVRTSLLTVCRNLIRSFPNCTVTHKGKQIDVLTG